MRRSSSGPRTANRRTFRSASTLLTLALALAACSDAPTSPGIGEAGAPRKAVPVIRVYEDSFRDAPPRCMRDGDTFGAWSVVFTGYGCVRRGSQGGTTWLEMAPQAVTDAGSTSAPLVVGPAFSNGIDFSVRATTDVQLRTGSAPNPWEVAWIAWHYTDPEHFYYFIPKPNGWELGKRDPAYPGGQRFLATGNSPVYPLGAWYEVRVVQSGSVMTVWVDGRHLVQFDDRERAYTAGRIGLYSEDAAVRFNRVRVVY